MNDFDQDLVVRVARATGLEEPPQVEERVDKPVVPEQNFEYLPLQKYYGVETPDERQVEQLKEVWDYYSKDRTPGETLKAIREAHLDLVAPEIGQTRLSQLADYVKIERIAKDSSAHKEAYLRPKEQDKEQK